MLHVDCVMTRALHQIGVQLIAWLTMAIWRSYHTRPYCPTESGSQTWLIAKTSSSLLVRFAFGVK